MKEKASVQSELLVHMIDFVTEMAAMEGAFGVATAVSNDGSSFRLCEQKPKWLQMGQPKKCFNNATACAAIRDDVWYAEGYVMEPELPFPVHHAWLIDEYGKVVDPTWKGRCDHVYFGIAFKKEFMLEALEANQGEAGILVNIHRLRKRYEKGRLDKVIAEGALRGKWNEVPYQLGN